MNIAPGKKIEWLQLGLVILLLQTVSSIWFCLDHSYPAQDEAGHILNTSAYHELFSHPQILHRHWWHQLANINRCYPPLVYIIGGVFKLVLGEHRSTDCLLTMFFNVLLLASLYTLSRQLDLRHKEGLMAMALLSFCPLTAALSHSYYLDIPMAAAATLSLALLLWWQKHHKPGNSIIIGLVTGILALVKHMVLAFWLGAALVVCYSMSQEKDQTKRKSNRTDLALALIGTAAPIVPWIIYNGQVILKLTASNLENLGAAAKSVNLVSSLTSYMTLLPECLSPLLLFLFLASLLAARLVDHKKLSVVTATSLLGILLTASWTAATPLPRYLMAFIIWPALYSAVALGRLIDSPRWLLKATAGLFLLLGLLQYIAVCFAPYPCAWLKPVLDLSGIREQELSGPERVYYCPTQKRNWGYEMVAEQVSKEPTDKAWLNVMINMRELNTHTFELFIKENNLPVRATSSRLWTIAGDKVEFKPETCLYYQWFLIKDGASGYKFFDSKSQAEYDRILDFVRLGRHFKLIDSTTAPDGTALELYRQTAGDYR